MSSSRSNTNDDNPSVLSARSSESPPVTGTKEYTQLDVGGVHIPYPLLREKRKKFYYKFSVRWCNAFKGSDELHTLNRSWAAFTSLRHAMQTHVRRHSEPIYALTFPTVISKCPLLRGFSTDDSSKFRKEDYRASVGYISEGDTRPDGTATAVNTSGGVSSHRY